MSGVEECCYPQTQDLKRHGIDYAMKMKYMSCSQGVIDLDLVEVDDDVKKSGLELRGSRESSRYCCCSSPLPGSFVA